MLLTSLLGWGGFASCTLGGLLALLGIHKGHEARRLGAALPVDNLSDLKQLFSLVPVLVAVTGRVMAPRPYRCELSDKDAAIVELRKEKVYEKRTSNFDAWVTYGELQSESVRECEWALADGSRVELPVAEGRHASGDYLQTSGDRLYPEQRNVVVRAAQEVLGSRPVGLREVERMLPVGTELTAVGELSTAVEHPSEFRAAVRRGGRMLVLKQPRGSGPFLLSRQPLPDVIASLQASSATCQQFATAFTLLGASMLAVAGTHKAVLWLRERRARQRFEKTLRERRAAAQAASGGAAAAAAAAASEGAGGAAAAGEADGEARGVCVICLARPPAMVFAPCGHLCVCGSCAPGLSRCPICRTRSEPIRVFTP